MDMITHDCPRCGTKNAGFSLQHPGKYVSEEDHGRGFVFDVLATCRVCERSVVATLSTGMARTINDARARYTTIEAVAPAPRSTKAPAFTPDNVARFFEQGMENLPRNWDAAGTMFRKALEAGLKANWPEVEGKLYQRIEKVAELGGLTDDMKDWAHQIRDDGNDAAHEDQPMRKDRAQALAEFTRLFLLYAFSLPGMLAQARGKSDDDDGSAA